MTTPAINIFTKVKQVAETTFNTPVSGTMATVPFVDCSLSPTITKVTDTTIQGDAQHRFVVPTTQKVAGTISGELMHQNADWLLQGIFYSNWANIGAGPASNISVSNTQTSYQIEVGHTDINEFFVYNGCVVDKLAFTFAPAALVTYKADFIGARFSEANATIATSTTAAGHYAPLTVTNATVKLNGNVAAYITGATVTWERKHTPSYVLGSPAPSQIVTSFFNAVGTLDLQVVDHVAYGYFVNNTQVQIDWTLTDGVNTYEISMPNLYLETFGMNNTGTGPVIAKANFTAVWDPTSATTATVTRSS